MVLSSTGGVLGKEEASRRRGVAKAGIGRLGHLGIRQATVKLEVDMGVVDMNRVPVVAIIRVPVIAMVRVVALGAVAVDIVRAVAVDPANVVAADIARVVVVVDIAEEGGRKVQRYW